VWACEPSLTRAILNVLEVSSHEKALYKCPVFNVLYYYFFFFARHKGSVLQACRVKDCTAIGVIVIDLLKVSSACAVFYCLNIANESAGCQRGVR